MAVSSTSNSSNSSIASIDVASIVEQLMKVESKPLDALTAKIDQQKLVISELGAIKSKIAIFQDALKDFENPNSYNAVSVSYPDPGVLTATGANGALLGNFSVKVNDLAYADTWTLKGFTAKSESISIDANGFNITVAGTTYNSKYPPTGISALASSPTVTDLVNWINSLDADVAASVVQTTNSSSYVLQIYGTKTGIENKVSFDGLSSYSSNTVNRIQGGNTSTLSKVDGSASSTETATVSFTSLASGQSMTIAGRTLTATADLAASDVATAWKTNTIASGGTFSGTLTGWTVADGSSETQKIFTSTTANSNVSDLTVDVTTTNLIHSSSAADAEIEVNGTTFIRSSNLITDVLDGISLRLVDTSATTQVISVNLGTDNSKTVIKKLIDSYNDLVLTHKAMVGNSYNSDKPGVFANQPTSLSFINEIKAKFAKGLTYGSAMTNTLSLSSIGIDFQLDGTVKFNELSFLDAQTNDLQSKLAQGVTTAYISSTNDLKQYLDDLIGITGGGGSIFDTLNIESEQLTDLQKSQQSLQTKLARIQDGLITQYSALNSLLYQLSQTSNALTSALDALNNNNN